jgi:hypothetical protein
MVQFEYKVVGVNTFQLGSASNSYNTCQVDSSVFENIINQFSKEGWEYQNSIMAPLAQSGDYVYYPKANLVFRRAKS